MKQREWLRERRPLDIRRWIYGAMFGVILLGFLIGWLLG